MLLRILLVVTLALAAAATRVGTMALTGATLVDGMRQNALRPAP